ncbi:ABC transporter substrate-binding protein [Candidatus Parabeggiatoa sp. HSG14]|uniref:ABC transporter substrate-binding protein n=1 Tax=Candidatus Parabeggiatoa sp. HSG14 TaxID=3055593 RepID=UPI0025A84663|nr:ABC transporter substrate-binding protein [Thiotrichales bacterium HSG14]
MNDLPSGENSPDIREEEFEQENKESNQENKKTKKGKKKFILIGLLISIIVLMSLIWKEYFFSSTGNTLYIAISGPFSGKGEANGKAMVMGVQLYLDQINQLGGIYDHPIKLLTFDDQNQSTFARKSALDIAQNSQALAVIGHYNSSASQAAAPIYQQYSIPAISGSATADEITRDNDWYFRTIFNNSEQGALIANYVKKVLNYTEANILFDEGTYGSTLTTAFIENAKMIGLEIKNQWSFNSKNNFNDSLEEMIKTLAASATEKHLLFMATHSTEATETLVALKQRLDGIHIQVVGADALSSTNFLKTLKNYPQEQIQPGYYSDNVYTISPLLFDIAGKRAQDFRYAFLKKYDEEPMATSAIYYDTAMVVVDAIKTMLAKEKEMANTLKEKRMLIKNNLWRLAKAENAVEGVTGSIYFDENGDAIKSIPIGIYEHGTLIAAMRQFQPLQSVENIDDLLQKVIENKIIEINDKFMSLAQVVYVGVDFNDISELDQKASTFTLDFYLWFRFKGDFDDRNIEFVNIFNPKNNSLGKPISEWHSSAEEGVVTKTYRLKTDFKVKLKFHNYPLDQQILSIYFRHKELTRNQLIYVVDERGMNLHQVDPQNREVDPQNREEENNFFSIGGWYVNKTSFFQNIQVNDSTWGITEFFDSQQRIEYSQFNATLTINRHVWNFILKTLLPVIFLVVLGYVSFFINAFSSKLGIGTNLILATSLFHLKLASELPKIDYLVLIEYFFYLVYLLAIFIILIAIFTHFHEENGSDKGKFFINRLNFFGKIIYPLVLIIFISLIFYDNYNMIMGIY